LDDDSALDAEGTHDSLGLIRDIIAHDERVIGRIEVRANRYQLTVRALRLRDVAGLWLIVNEIVRRSGISGLQVVQSSHSIDVINPATTKRSVIDRICSAFAISAESVLAIGDKGGLNGNDYHLLTSSLSLSVDEVSADLHTCWNVSPPGIRGPQATRVIFRHLHRLRDGESVQLRVPR
jgi:hypothetical protein